MKAKTPLTKSPKLKSEDVMPETTPKSLRALFVQLNVGYDAMAVRMQTNAIIGDIIPEAAPIFW